MKLALSFDLVKGADLPFLRHETPGPVSRHLDEKGYFVTTGIGPDLMEGARRRGGHDRSALRHLRHVGGRGVHALQRLR